MRDFHSGLIQNSQVIDRKTVEIGVGERIRRDTYIMNRDMCRAVASILNGSHRARSRNLSSGGNLQIEWNEEDNHVYMTGPATVVFDGGDRTVKKISHNE